MRITGLIKKFILVLFFPLCLFLITMGCEEDCFTNHSNMMQIGFFNKEHKAEGVLIDTIYALNTDSAVFQKVSSTGAYKLPLPYSFDTASFIFSGTKITSTDTTLEQDTLVVTFLKDPSFNGTACGFDMNLHDLSVIYQTFDSISIINTSIVTDPIINVEIYY